MKVALDMEGNMAEETFEITMELKEGYKFLVDFQDQRIPSLALDEPPPLGEGEGPHAVRLLAAAVGNCLSASALFCLRRARIEVKSMRTGVETELGRNEQGRLRIQAIKVRIEPAVAEEDIPRMKRCLEVFEDYCTVTGSVRGGIEVKTDVSPRVVAPALS
jgi:organic hydroperoxide reductase OsmC/OhrA